MASIEQRGKSYRVIFRFDGQRYTRSLQTKCERTATAALLRLEDNLRRVQLGTLLVPEAADSATFLLSDGQVTTQAKPEAEPKPQPRISTLSKLCEQYLDSMPEGALESTTLECLQIHIRHFRRVFGTRFQSADMDLAELQKYVNKRAKAKGRRGKPLSAKTIKKELASLSTIWSWALQHKYVHEPLNKAGLRLPKTDEKPPFQTMAEVNEKIALGGLSENDQAELWDAVFLTVPEVSELLEFVRTQALHPFIYPMFAFAAHTGARRSEIIRSQVHDIDLKNGKITLREKKRSRGQRTRRSVPISPFLTEVMRDWFGQHPGGNHTFPIETVVRTSKIRLQPMQLTPDEATRHFRQTMDGSQWNNLRGWHLFRHSFCSNCAAAGVDQRLIDEWVGHQTDEMRRRYRHLIPSQQQEAISAVFGAI